MANTRIQREAEEWVRTAWMSERFGRTFTERGLRLDAGGSFKFDAVSADESIVASISTSACRTRNGKYGSGKMMKIRSDILFLLMACGVQHRLIVVTDRGMYDQLQKELQAGRLPKAIEFLHVELPQELCARLAISQSEAADEVAATPRSTKKPELK